MAEEKVPLEIERKFLIRMPDTEKLKQLSTRRIEITQIYLTPGELGSVRRLRRSRWDGGEARYFTEKLRLSDRTRIEREREITDEEWETLYAQRDEELRIIEKVRWCVPFAGHTLEIDVFPFWTDRAFCEAELESEDEPLELPDWLQLVREVSADRRYTNYALARRLPEEDLDAPLISGEDVI